MTNDDVALEEKPTKEHTKKTKEPVSFEIMAKQGKKMVLRDGKEYLILPFLLDDAMEFLDTMEGISLTPIYNLVDPERRKKYLKALHMILSYAQPDLSIEQVGKIVDTQNGQEIIELALGLNGIKK